MELYTISISRINTTKKEPPVVSIHTDYTRAKLDALELADKIESGATEICPIEDLREIRIHKYEANKGNSQMLIETFRNANGEIYRDYVKEYVKECVTENGSKKVYVNRFFDKDGNEFCRKEQLI